MPFIYSVIIALAVCGFVQLMIWLDSKPTNEGTISFIILLIKVIFIAAVILSYSNMKSEDDEIRLRMHKAMKQEEQYKNQRD